MRELIFKRMAWGFAIVGVCLAALTVLNYRMFHSLTEHSAWVAHSHEVRAEVESLRASIIQSESARRGYVITGEAERLDDFTQARERTQDSLESLKRLTSDNPRQQERLRALEPLVKSHVDFSERVVNAKRRSDEEAKTITLTNQGVHLMADLQSIIAEMNADEDQLLAQRIEGERASFVRFGITSGVFIGAAVLFLITFAVLLWRGAGVRANASSKLSDIRSWLKRRETVSVSNGEMARLTTELKALSETLTVSLGRVKETK